MTEEWIPKNQKKKHYQDLARELRKIWDIKVKVIPLVIDDLQTTPIKLRNWLKKIGIETQIIEFLKTVILHTARII